MRIEVQCEQCGKTFDVPASMAGKRGRCDLCGHVFWIARPRPTSGPVIDSPIRPDGRPAMLIVPPRQRTHRSGDRFTFPKAALLDAWLPITLIILGYGIPAVYIARDFSMMRLLSLALFIALVIPAAFLGAALAGRRWKYELPEHAGFRMVAVVAVPLALTFAVILPLGIWSSYLLAGWLIGAFPAFFIFWFLYRLRFKEALQGFACALVAATVAAVAVGWSLQLLVDLSESPQAHKQPEQPADSSLSADYAASPITQPATRPLAP